jgi:hypothetical protein
LHKINPFPPKQRGGINGTVFIMQAPKPKDVLPLAQEITRLETQLADAKRRWNLLFGISEPEKRRRAASVDGVSAKAVAFLERIPASEYTISAVAEEIGEKEIQVGRALYRLARNGTIVNPSRGRYKAKEQEAPIAEAS